MIHQTTLHSGNWPAIMAAALRASEKVGRPITEVLRITPEMAGEILARNAENRKIAWDKVATYAADSPNCAADGWRRCERWMMCGEL